MSHNLLASYCSSDNEKIRPLIEFLKNAGLTIAEKPDVQITTNDLGKTKGIIVFISERYLSRIMSERELSALTARTGTRPFILVRMEIISVDVRCTLLLDAPVSEDVVSLQNFAMAVQSHLPVFAFAENLETSEETETIEVYPTNKHAEHFKVRSKARRSLFEENSSFGYGQETICDWSHFDSGAAADCRPDDGSEARPESSEPVQMDYEPEVIKRIAESLGLSAEPSAESLAPSVLVAKVDEVKPVVLGASAPQEVKPGEEFIANFLAYLPEFERTVRKVLKKQSSRAEMRPGLEKCLWKKGTKVQVFLSADKILLDSAEEEFEWDGEYKILSFDVKVPKKTQEGPVVLKFEVIIAGIRVAKLRAEVAVKKITTSRSKITVTGKPASTAFASYASEDRERVTERLAALRIHAGIDVYMDHLSLIPNKDWEEQLALAIESREIFLLFWSKEAEKSKWVKWEWQRAFELEKQRGIPGFEIHPLENGIKPPKKLGHLHFGDVYMTIRETAARGGGR